MGQKMNLKIFKKFWWKYSQYTLSILNTQSQRNFIHWLSHGPERVNQQKTNQMRHKSREKNIKFFKWWTIWLPWWFHQLYDLSLEMDECEASFFASSSENRWPIIARQFWGTQPLPPPPPPTNNPGAAANKYLMNVRRIN